MKVICNGTIEEVTSLLGPALDIYDQLQSRKPGEKKDEDPSAPFCGLHKVRMVLKEGVSQKTGQYYKFYGCPVRNEDNSFCKWKPPKEENGK